MGTTLVGQMPSFTYTSGPTMPFGADLETLAQFTLGVQTGITAKASGTQTNGTPLGVAPIFAEVDTVATNGDSVVLPPATLPGDSIFINNMGAATLDIYANPGTNIQNGTTLDTIVPHGSTTANSNSTALTLAAGHVTYLVCFVTGVWKQVADFS